ncbi:hypothetical protein ACOME3_009186 [Neoechinorhynchus agilis]
MRTKCDGAGRTGRLVTGDDFSKNPKKIVNVKALNSQFSLLRDFITFVGSSHSDSSVIREEIMRLRTSIRDCASKVESELSFCISGDIANKGNRSMSTSHCFLTCLELIISELRKMRYLHKTFPHVNNNDENQSTVLGTLVIRHACTTNAKVQTAETVTRFDGTLVDRDIRCLMDIKTTFNTKLNQACLEDSNLRPGKNLK